MLRFIALIVAALSWYAYNNHLLFVHKWKELTMPYQSHLFVHANDPELNQANCKTVHREFGACEDLILDDQTGLIYLPCASADSRSKYFPGLGNFDYEALEGKNQNSVYLYNPKTDEGTALEIRGYDGEDFINHGMDMIVAEDNSRLLFFVNHKNGQSVISVFSHKIDDKHIDHLYDAEHGLIDTPNSVAAVGPNSFYVTNDHAFRNSPGRELAECLGSFGRHTGIAYCNHSGEDGTKCEKKAWGFAYANGLTRIGEDKVALADTLGAYVTVFERDTETNDLTKIVSTPMGSPLDNVRADKNGDLIVASFPVVGESVARLGDVTNTTKRASVQALKLSKDDGYTTAEVILREKGDHFSILTGAIVDPKSQTLYGGSCGEEGILVCQL